MTLKSIISTLGGVSWLKTVYFNFHYLPFIDALRLPIFIYRRTKLHSLSGSIKFNVPCRTGIVMIGIHGVGIIDNKYERTIWQCNGVVEFNGSARFGSGTKLSINKNAILSIGNKFCITGRSTIICSKDISFGDECLLSWDILIMDTDFHNIYEDRNLINIPKPIRIGNHVWIGCRNMVLKGVTIPNNVIVAASSVITKHVDDSECIVGNKIIQCNLKNAVTWSI